MDKPTGRLRKIRSKEVTEKITNTKIFYFRDKNNVPLVTVYSICVGDDKWYKGVAFCSHKDTLNKNRGRQIAMGRAIFAAMSDLTYYCDRPNKRILKRVKLTVDDMHNYLHNDLPFPPSKKKPE